jgi:hypothetical protein
MGFWGMVELLESKDLSQQTSAQRFNVMIDYRTTLGDHQMVGGCGGGGLGT